MLLIITNSSDETADYLASRLDSADVPYLRLDTDLIVGHSRIRYQSHEPRLEIYGRWWGPDEFTNIWYRRPEVLKVDSGDESPEVKYAIDEWTDALEGFLAHIPAYKWVNHPVYNSQASKKLEQLTTASKLGFKVPATLVTQDESELRMFFEECKGSVIIKPLSSGLVKGSSGDENALIYTSRVDERDLEDLSGLNDCPSFFQAFVTKSSDVRITVIDGRINAVCLAAKDETGSQICDIRVDNMSSVKYSGVELPEEINQKILDLMRHYRLRFAAIDMVISTAGEWMFLEVNPNGQWAWLDIFGGQDIGSSFVEVFQVLQGQ